MVQSTPEGVGAFTSAGTQLPPPSAGGVFAPSSLRFSGDCSLTRAFVAPQSFAVRPIHLCSLSTET